MGTQEDRYVDCFYKKYSGRVAIGVGYAQGMVEVFPLVLEDGNGRALGIIAMATQSNEQTRYVHIFHLSVFNTGCGDGSKMLEILCLKADELNVMLSVSPIPSPNGKNRQMNGEQLTGWYRKYGFTGDAPLCRLPASIDITSPPALYRV